MGQAILEQRIAAGDLDVPDASIAGKIELIGHDRCVAKVSVPEARRARLALRR